MSRVSPSANPPTLPTQPGARRTALLLLRAQERMDELVREDGPTRTPWARGSLLAVAAVVALVAAGGLAGVLIRGVDPALVFEADTTAHTKFRVLEAYHEPPDVLIVGSSRVRRQIDPELFDQILAEEGFEVRSYNLGLSALRHAECRTLVRRILRSERRPKTLVVELIGNLTHVFGRLLHDENPGSARVVAWHDSASTSLVIRAALASDMSGEEKRAALTSHLVHFGQAWFNLGLGIPFTALLLGYDDGTAVDRGRGYTPLEARARNNPRLQESHEEMRNSPDVLRTKVQRRLDLDIPRRPPRILLESLREMVREAEAAGVEVVFLLLPPHWTVEENEAFSANRRFGLPPILDYRDPRKHPAFYGSDLLFNFNHLNTAGSERLTRRVARDLARLWSTEDP